MSNYHVVFEGDISKGHQLQDVKKNLAALFKIDDKKVDVLFSKQQVVLKKGLDYESAMKYRKAILNTGAVCNVKADAAATGDLELEKTGPPEPVAQALKQAVPPPISNQSAIPATENPTATKLELSETASSGNKSVQGIGDIIAGVVLIGIGFTFGGSVFLGNPDMLDYIFDGLGLFWIGRGIYKMVR